MPLTKEEEARVKQGPIQVSAVINVDAKAIPDINQISINANARVLDYITEVNLVMDNDAFTFTTAPTARPFNGVFEAEIAAFIFALKNDNVLPGAPSIVNVTFDDRSEAYKEMEKKVNRHMEQWFGLAQATVDHYFQRTTDLMEAMIPLSANLCTANSCQ